MAYEDLVLSYLAASDGGAYWPLHETGASPRPQDVGPHGWHGYQASGVGTSGGHVNLVPGSALYRTSYRVTDQRYSRIPIPRDGGRAYGLEPVRACTLAGWLMITRARDNRYILVFAGQASQVIAGLQTGIGGCLEWQQQPIAPNVFKTPSGTVALDHLYFAMGARKTDGREVTLFLGDVGLVDPSYWTKMLATPPRLPMSQSATLAHPRGNGGGECFLQHLMMLVGVELQYADFKLLFEAGRTEAVATLPIESPGADVEAFAFKT